MNARPRNKRLEAKYLQESNRRNAKEAARRERFVHTAETKVQRKIRETK